MCRQKINPAFGGCPVLGPVASLHHQVLDLGRGPPEHHHPSCPDNHGFVSLVRMDGRVVSHLPQFATAT